MNPLIQILVLVMLLRSSLQTDIGSTEFANDVNLPLDERLKVYIQKAVEQQIASIKGQCQENARDISMYRDQIKTLQVDVQRLKNENTFFKSKLLEKDGIKISSNDGNKPTRVSEASPKHQVDVDLYPENNNQSHHMYLTNSHDVKPEGQMIRKLNGRQVNKDRSSSIKKRVSSTPLITDPDDKVAFAATMTHDQSATAANEILVFDSILNQMNRGYSRHSGVFTCPVAGTYVFHHTLRMKYGNHCAYTDIVRNDQVIATNIGMSTSGHGDTGSTMTIANLAQGDEVWVRVSPRGHSPSANIVGDFSSFSGFLLYKM